MRLACAGKGKIGIRRSVGCDYVKADRKKARGRRRNPVKYRLLVDKDLKPLRHKRSSSGSNLPTVAVLGLIGVGIFFAWSKSNGS
jgi:hypothetical protein